MGGSLALRLKQDRICRKVVALVRRESAAAEAMAQSVVDFATTDPLVALKDADIVIFTTPVKILVAQLQNFASYFKAGAIITDVGSTKSDILAALEALPPAVHPVGSHPMCGKETSGLAAAESTLYDGATWIVSPLQRTPRNAIGLIETLARAVGAIPLQIEATQHDKLVAAISHLPYLLSAGLVLTAQSMAEKDARVWDVAASGFKDTSRIAASNVQMMLDILLTNQNAVLAMIDQFSETLSTLRAAIENGDEAQLQNTLARAKSIRDRLYADADL